MLDNFFRKNNSPMINKIYLLLCLFATKEYFDIYERFWDKKKQPISHCLVSDLFPGDEFKKINIKNSRPIEVVLFKDRRLRVYANSPN